MPAMQMRLPIPAGFDQRGPSNRRQSSCGNTQPVVTSRTGLLSVNRKHSSANNLMTTALPMLLQRSKREKLKQACGAMPNPPLRGIGCISKRESTNHHVRPIRSERATQEARRTFQDC